MPKKRPRPKPPARSVPLTEGELDLLADALSAHVEHLDGLVRTGFLVLTRRQKALLVEASIRAQVLRSRLYDRWHNPPAATPARPSGEIQRAAKSLGPK